jgi:cytochrome c-type biogenesis protein CcmH/NrfG
MPRLLLGSVALPAILLSGLALLGHWQAEASGAATQRQAPPAAYRSSDPSVPAASEVLTDPAPEQADHVATF